MGDCSSDSPIVFYALKERPGLPILVADHSLSSREKLGFTGIRAHMPVRQV